MTYKTLIVGYGTTGKNLHREIAALKPDTCDLKFKENYGTTTPLRKYDNYDIIFICVDTPYVNNENLCDLSAIKSVIREWKGSLTNDGVFVIKSTILPGTARCLEYEFNVNIVVSPEYYGNTYHCNNFDFNFTILGGCKAYCIIVQQALQKCYDARHQFKIVDHETAELVKYMENSWLATKVAFCSQFALLAEHCGVDYEELRELFILDPRVNPSHTFIDRDKPYWDSHCLNKDVRAITYTHNADFLLGMINFNERRKKKSDKNDFAVE